MDPQLSNDIIRDVVGDFGKWQLRTTLLIYLCKIPSAWFMACIIFTAPFAQSGEYFCRRSIESSDPDVWISAAHPTTGAPNSTIDYCYVYTNAEQRIPLNATSSQSDHNVGVDANVNDSVLACAEFEHRSIYDSLVTQFDLVCSRTILIAVTQFWHLFGVLTGGILATLLLNYFSPKNVMLFGMITQIFCGCLTGLVSSFSLHIFFRYLSAVCCAQMYTAGQMIFSDITAGNYRKSVICLFETFWGIGIVLLPLVAHLFTSWTSIYLAISLPTTVYILIWPWIPDSPRWLIRHGDTKNVKKILLNAAKVNDRQYLLPQNLDHLINVQTAASLKIIETANWWSLWPDRTSIVTMVMLHTAWAIYVTNYNGMLLNIRAFSRNFLAANTIAAGLSEIFGVLLAWFIVMKMSRNKWYWTGIFNIFTGILSCFGFFIPDTLSDNVYVILGMTLAILAKMATTCSQTVLVTSTAELVSPDKQKICIFSCIVWARIWLLTAPFIGVITFIHNLLPMAVFGLLGLIGGICTCIINYYQHQQQQHSHIEKNPHSHRTEVYIIDKSAW